jgi:hypothetical protein
MTFQGAAEPFARRKPTAIPFDNLLRDAKYQFADASLPFGSFGS